MFQYFKALAAKIGIDKAIAYSSGARIIQAFTGVASIFFVTRYLTDVEQGFYYTFGSLIALQVFFELGFTGILTQYVAHEASHLEIKSDNSLEGDGKYISRLASLVRFSVKWYSIIALLFFVIVFVIGYCFFYRFNQTTEEVSWVIPWIMVVVSASISLIQSPISSIILGLNKVKEINKVRFFQQIIIPLSSWIGLICGFKLYVLGVSSVLSVVIWTIYIYKSRLIKILVWLWKVKVEEKVSYVKEIFPYQWRIALSWISGYFIFQLFNPVLFATEGPAIAGQMGMTLAVLNGIQALSLSWLNTKVPLYSGLIAKGEYNKLDNIFNLTLKQMSFVCLSLLSIMFIGVFGMRFFQIRLGDNLLGDRFLDYIPMLLMMSTVYINQYVASWATYVRCHKQEPFLLNSICGGVINALSTIFLGKYFGLYGITIGYFIITLAFMPWSYWIYKTKKNEWHR